MRPKNFRRLWGVLRRSQLILPKPVVLVLRKLVALTIAVSMAAAAVAQEESQTSLGERFSDEGIRLNMSMFDSYLANWDSKFEYNRWRPYTAIREAANDGNPATAPDSNWEPLRTTPPHPEYASAHSTVCGSSFEILKRTFGDQVSFTMETTTAPPEMPTRSFRSFSAAAAECADSRVRLGWHFRYATNGGLALGRAVA